MTTSEAARRFPWVLTLCFLPALALLIGLGAWQVQRLHWKEGLIAQAEAAAAEPVIEWWRPEDLAPFRKFELSCPGIQSAPFLELQTIRDGEPGVRLISVCRPEGVNAVLLIDRGFVAESISARPPVEPSDQVVVLFGEFRTVPKPGPFAPPPPEPGHRFLVRDEAAMAQYLEAGPVAGTIFATTSTNPEFKALQPSVPPVAFSNNHLGYAATWFGLALALAGFYAAMVMRRMKP